VIICEIIVHLLFTAQNNKRCRVQRIKILETQGNSKRQEIMTHIHGVICHQTAVKTWRLRNTECAKVLFVLEISHSCACENSCSIFYPELHITLTINVGIDGYKFTPRLKMCGFYCDKFYDGYSHSIKLCTHLQVDRKSEKEKNTGKIFIYTLQ